MFSSLAPHSLCQFQLADFFCPFPSFTQPLLPPVVLLFLKLSVASVWKLQYSASFWCQGTHWPLKIGQSHLLLLGEKSLWEMRLPRLYQNEVQVCGHNWCWSEASMEPLQVPRVFTQSLSCCFFSSRVEVAATRILEARTRAQKLDAQCWVLVNMLGAGQC